MAPKKTTEEKKTDNANATLKRWFRKKVTTSDGIDGIVTGIGQKTGKLLVSPENGKPRRKYDADQLTERGRQRQTPVPTPEERAAAVESTGNRLISDSGLPLAPKVPEEDDGA